LINNWVNTSWIAASNSITNQRFHIDLGLVKVIDRIYYENLHYFGTITNAGVKNFTFWGSNSVSDFNDLVYAHDGTWTQLTTNVSQFDEHIASDQEDPKYISVTNTTAYRYYAFKFANNWGSTSLMGIRRIELQQVPVETQAVLTLLHGATQNLSSVNAKDIDSSAGQTIWTHRGVLNNATNWKELVTPKAISNVF